MLCKAIVIGLLLTPIKVLLAQGLFYSVQPFPEAWTGSPQLHREVFGGETEDYVVPVQVQPQAQWGPIPYCPGGTCCPTQQGTYFRPPIMGSTPEFLNNGTITYGTPSIGCLRHDLPPIETRPVLRFLIRPRKPAGGRTT